MSSTLEYLSPAEAIAFPLEWYGHAGQEHFWMRGRNLAFETLRAQVEALQRPGLRVLDVGAGHCAVANHLEGEYGWTVDAVELNQGALEQAMPLRGRKLYYNLLHKNPALLGRYDLVVLYDVLEHIEDPQSVLRAAHAHLRPGGHLVINVPAGEWLRSRYDEIVGHHLRYDFKTLNRVLGAQWEVAAWRYWGFLLVPFLLARKVVLALSREPKEKLIERGFPNPIAPLHALLHALMRLDIRKFSKAPCGGSLMAIARKRETAL